MYVDSQEELRMEWKKEIKKVGTVNFKLPSLNLPGRICFQFEPRTSQTKI
jgi:hypothetical protein